jgi:hypothetical protein
MWFTIVCSNGYGQWWPYVYAGSEAAAYAKCHLWAIIWARQGYYIHWAYAPGFYPVGFWLFAYPRDMVLLTTG